MYALFITLGLFASILLLTRCRVPLAAAVSCAAVAVGPLFELSLSESAVALLHGAIQPTTLALVLLTVLLLVLSRTMKEAGQMERIVTLTGAILRRPAIAMAVLPALIGLLPMPGGALFSAPMVESAAGKTRLPGALLSAVNYWFRHIWEHWWPLYPGVVLAMTLTESPLGAFVVYQIPLGFGMVISGLLLFRGTQADLHTAGKRPDPGTKRKLIRAASPIWVLLLAWAGTRAVVKVIEPATMPEALRPVLRSYFPIVAGILVALVCTVRLNRMSRHDVRRVFADRSPYLLGLLVLCIMVFRHMLGVSGAAPRIAGELTALHVPIEFVVMALPFIAGMVTGLAVGFVGTSFPIVIALVAAMPGDVWLRPYVALAYAFGHLGQMLSPLHVCHIMSNRYFETGFEPVYRRILPAAGLTAILAMLYFLLLRRIGPVA